METSPIRFLDYDVSLMLADQVRLSQEVKARKFHYNLYTYEHKLPLYEIYELKYFYRGHIIISRALNGLGRYWGDFWDEELSGKTTKSSISRRIILYEEELKI